MKRLITLLASLSLGLSALLVGGTVPVFAAPAAGCVTLYEKAGYDGGSYTTCVSVANFSGKTFNNGVPLNDNVTSFKFQASRTHTRIQLYKNANYDTIVGATYMDCVGSCSIEKIPTLWNDTASSVKLY